MADEINDHVKVEIGGASESRRNRLITLIVGIVLLILLAVAIGVVVSNDDDSTPTTTTAPPSTDTTVSTVNQKVLADYRAFWDAYLEASDPMRPDHPSLAAHSTGEEYALLVNSFSGAKASNVVFRGTIDINAKVVSVEGSRAVVRDCIDDKTGSYDVTTGERQDTDDPQRKLSDAVLQLVDGTWKVSSLENKGPGCSAP